MAPWIPIVASFLQSAQQQTQERKALQQSIAQQYAQSLGAEPYGMQVANWKAQRGNKGLPNLLSLIQLGESAFSGGDSAGGWQSQDDYKGPGKVTSAGYAGRLSARDF